MPEQTFIPTCRAEMEARGWTELDILFVSGDAYIDHPAFGVPLLARLLEAEGYRVGILAQPDWREPEALRGMGRPKLFAAASSGAMDSMVNHYTAGKRLRSNDAYSPGGRAGLRPNRALIAYTAALKRAHAGLPVVLGGIEASLRRFAHYDYWDDKVRRSILFDSKADLLVYGMAESPLREIARRVTAGEAVADLCDVPGTARIDNRPRDGVNLPSYEECADDPRAFVAAFSTAQHQQHAPSARPLLQRHGSRYLVVMPPAPSLSEAALDAIYALPFTRRPHPAYREPIPAYAQIRFSVTSHRGCCGGCSFCAIAAHQGRDIQSRSRDSLVAEVERMRDLPGFTGALSDVGGPTANMYGVACSDAQARARCVRTSCLYPKRCRNLAVSDKRAVRMLTELRKLPGISTVPVASGIRHDLLEAQPDYLQELIAHHVGGLLKIAPETLATHAAAPMQKPPPEVFARFLERFRELSRRQGRRYGVVPYLMAGHPGCTLDDAIDTALFLKRHGLRVEQVQIFTPTPGTRSTCMWHTGIDPERGEALHVPRDLRERQLQKAVLLFHLGENRALVEQALRRAGRESDLAKLYGRGQRKGSRRRSRRK